MAPLPRQAEPSRLPALPIPSAATPTQTANLPNSSVDIKENDHDLHHSSPSGKTPAPADEYTILLKKHLDVVESELGRLKGLHSAETSAIDGNGTHGEVEDDDNGMLTQEATICRIAPWRWREVKKERTINTNLPTLLVTSKGHGRLGRSSTRRRSTKGGIKPGRGASTKEDSKFESAYRVAINSRILLDLLGDLTGVDFPEDRNVWIRPFKYLVAYEAEIRQAAQEAEDAVRQLEAGTAPSDHDIKVGNHREDSTPTLESVREKEEADVDVAEPMPSVNAMKATRAKAERDQFHSLVNFMDTDMKDIFDVNHQVANQTLKEVAFEHLWLLYKPGDLIYTTRSHEEHDTYQAYRILHVTGGRSVLDAANDSNFKAIHSRDWEDESETEEKARDAIRGSLSNLTPFIIDCFSIDYDGNRIGPRSWRFVIPTYTGQRKVNALEVCPAIFHPHHQDVRRKLVERGRRFTQLASGTHQRYSGMTLRESRELWEQSMSYYNYVIHDEEVHGEIMLDHGAAVSHYRKTYDKWRLKIGGRIIGVPTSADRREVFDPLPVKRDEDLFSDVFDDSLIDIDRRTNFINSTTLLKYQKISEKLLSDDYVMLLPFRVYGYAMLNRKWFPMNINLVHDITAAQVQRTADGYEDLVLPDGHKKLLQAIVKNQVRDPKQLRTRREEDSSEFQMDVVQGKGKGLIILLHGAPGVGKTSTAECVAAQLKRPLLPITCGDIGTSVKIAETTLQEYCTLAHRWRCVLLLDEADVFLAKREKGDIQRNGLVSVFLRVLEYFSGVIILTTNRVGEFDEAFRSRIHVSLYYPKIDQNATIQIWERNLQRLKKSTDPPDFSEDEIRKFARQQWLDNVNKPSRHWNGRQIKNAFQTALALANWEFYETNQGRTLERPLLKARHFNRVAQTSAHFDDYISDVYNISDDAFSVLAARDEIRKDSHPAGGLDRRDTKPFIPRSKRTAPTRRDAPIRNAMPGQGSKPESPGENARVRQLELELELMKLKQGNTKKEGQARTEVDGDEEKEEEEGEEEEEEGW